MTKAEAKEKTKEKKKAKMLNVEQVCSGIGGKESQIKSLKALGLGKIGRRVVLEDNACVRGLVRKVFHLVKVGDSNG
jgi:large subunit ribosomal protein L30